MSYDFTGWSAYDIVGPLNKREVHSALLDFEIEKSCFRTWDSIEAMLMRSCDVVKGVVYESSMAKRKVEEQHRLAVLKRKREEQSMVRNVRRRLGEFFFFFFFFKKKIELINMITVRGEGQRDFSKFMVVPNADEERHCYESFFDATSNEALTLQVCPVCAREKLDRDGEYNSLLSDETVVEVLESGRVGEGSVILRHLLEIDERGVNCWMCWECIRALKRRTIPKLSLANNLWIGDTPF